MRYIRPTGCYLGLKTLTLSEIILSLSSLRDGDGVSSVSPVCACLLRFPARPIDTETVSGQTAEAQGWTDESPKAKLKPDLSGRISHDHVTVKPNGQEEGK